MIFYLVFSLVYVRGRQPFLACGLIFFKEIARGPKYLDRSLRGPHLFKLSSSNQKKKLDQKSDTLSNSKALLAHPWSSFKSVDDMFLIYYIFKCFIFLLIFT